VVQRQKEKYKEKIEMGGMGAAFTGATQEEEKGRGQQQRGLADPRPSLSAGADRNCRQTIKRALPGGFGVRGCVGKTRQRTRKNGDVMRKKGEDKFRRQRKKNGEVTYRKKGKKKRKSSLPNRQGGEMQIRDGDESGPNTQGGSCYGLKPTTHQGRYQSQGGPAAIKKKSERGVRRAHLNTMIVGALYG